MPLRDAQARLLFDLMPGVAWATDRDLRFTASGGGALPQLGLEPDEVVGRTVMEYVGTDDPSFPPVAAHLRALAGERASFELEWQGRVFDAEVGPLEGTAGGEPAGTVGVAVEVTRRARAERTRHEAVERLAAIVESSSEAIVSVDREGTILSWNRAAESIYGYGREEAVGRPMSLVVPEDRASEPYELLERILRGEHVEPRETVRRRKDGSVTDVLVRYSPLHDPDGRIVGASTIASDLGPRRALEENLRRSQKLEAVGRLAGGVAHDFNNLLTALRMYGELALAHADAGDVEAVRGEIGGMLDTTEHASRLVRQLLALGRRQFLVPTRTDLNELVRGLESLLARLLGEDVTLDVRLAPDLGHVEVDRAQLEQVLLNLAANARDAMPTGGRLTIETTNVDHDGARAVCLAVADTGHGIDPEARAQIFEPFFTTKPEGHGLGLATVYGVVAQSGGSIDVESDRGRGTTFRILLPRDDAPAEPAAAAAPPAREAGGTETVLLVEDDDAVRRLVAQALAAEGYAVLEAESPERALALAEEHEGPVDLVVTDVVMPGLSGRELAERLRPLRPEARVLYVSGYTSDAAIRRGVLEADVAFLQKPFSGDELRRKVRATLDEA